MRCNFRNKSGSSWEEKINSFFPSVLWCRDTKSHLDPAFGHLLGWFLVSLPCGEYNNFSHDIAANSTGQDQLHFCMFYFCAWLLLLACVETCCVSETSFGLSPKTLQMLFNFTFTLIKWWKLFASFLPTSSIPLSLSTPDHNWRLSPTEDLYIMIATPWAAHGHTAELLVGQHGFSCSEGAPASVFSFSVMKTGQKHIQGSWLLFLGHVIALKTRQTGRMVRIMWMSGEMQFPNTAVTLQKQLMIHEH